MSTTMYTGTNRPQEQGKPTTRRTRAAILLLSAALATSGLSVAVAAPATAARPCLIKVLSLTSWDLQDNDPQDEIKFDLGGDEYGMFTFPDNWTRSASLGSPTKHFNGSVRFELWDKDSVVKDSIDTAWLSCTAGTHTADLVGNGAIYELKYHITP